MLILRRCLHLGLFLGQFLWRIPRLKFYPGVLVQHLYQVGPPLLPAVLGLNGLFSLMIMHVLNLAVDQAEPLGIAFALAFCQQVPLMVCSGLLAIQLAAVSAQELLQYQQNQQLEVLRWMGISAIDYLLFPRLLAGFILFPLLLVFAFTIGLCTATIITAQLYTSGDVLLFWGGIRSILSLQTLVLIFLKGSCLGLTIALTGYTWGQTPLNPSERSNQTHLDRWTPPHAAISAWGLAMLCNLALSSLGGLN
jgi:ABC-type transporter Mla maintaining outer membrane lipid asymmetry permease subunit MlaE